MSKGLDQIVQIVNSFHDLFDDRSKRIARDLWIDILCLFSYHEAYNRDLKRKIGRSDIEAYCLMLASNAIIYYEFTKRECFAIPPLICDPFNLIIFKRKEGLNYDTLGESYECGFIKLRRLHKEIIYKEIKEGLEN